ncbi:MAG TPA: 50S ribosomal protein L4 [Gemmatimonadota bacterium]|nr:50S ribosomal protein L4 [Gemmatimonadota bacterium]
MMAEVKCYTMSGASDRAVDLPDEWFGMEISKHALYQAIRAQRTNDRAGTASTKTRAQVRGGGAKPWRQKGTGRARAGSIRSPLWTGGGIIHGPAAKRWSERPPRRVRQIAFASALTERAKSGSVRVVELETFEAPKTAMLARALERWDAPGKVLLLIARADENLLLSGRNMARLTVKRFADASALDVLSHDVVIVEEGAWDTRPAPQSSSAERSAIAARSATAGRGEAQDG